MFKIGCGGMVVLLIVAAVAVAIYKPEWLPSGVGYRTIPVEISERDTLLGLSHEVVVKNVGEETLKDVEIIWTRKPVDREEESGDERTITQVTKEKKFVAKSVPPGKSATVSWSPAKGDTIRVAAPGYLAKSIEF
jgi:hypothetical protein